MQVIDWNPSPEELDKEARRYREINTTEPVFTPKPIGKECPCGDIYPASYHGTCNCGSSREYTPVYE